MNNDMLAPSFLPFGNDMTPPLVAMGGAGFMAQTSAVPLVTALGLGLAAFLRRRTQIYIRVRKWPLIFIQCLVAYVFAVVPMFNHQTALRMCYAGHVTGHEAAVNIVGSTMQLPWDTLVTVDRCTSERALDRGLGHGWTTEARIAVPLSGQAKTPRNTYSSTRSCRSRTIIPGVLTRSANGTVLHRDVVGLHYTRLFATDPITVMEAAAQARLDVSSGRRGHQPVFGVFRHGAVQAAAGYTKPEAALASAMHCSARSPDAAAATTEVFWYCLSSAVAYIYASGLLTTIIHVRIERLITEVDIQAMSADPFLTSREARRLLDYRSRTIWFTVRRLLRHQTVPAALAAVFAAAALLGLTHPCGDNLVGKVAMLVAFAAPLPGLAAAAVFRLASRKEAMGLRFEAVLLIGLAILAFAGRVIGRTAVFDFVAGTGAFTIAVGGAVILTTLAMPAQWAAYDLWRDPVASWFDRRCGDVRACYGRCFPGSGPAAEPYASSASGRHKGGAAPPGARVGGRPCRAAAVVVAHAMAMADNHLSSCILARFLYIWLGGCVASGSCCGCVRRSRPYGRAAGWACFWLQCGCCVWEWCRDRALRGRHGRRPRVRSGCSCGRRAIWRWAGDLEAETGWPAHPAVRAWTESSDEADVESEDDDDGLRGGIEGGGSSGSVIDVARTEAAGVARRRGAEQEVGVEAVLRTPGARVLFVKHLRREFCVESALFVLDAWRLEDAEEIPDDDLEEAAGVVWSRFVAPGSEMWVNLSALVVRRVSKSLWDLNAAGLRIPGAPGFRKPPAESSEGTLGMASLRVDSDEVEDVAAEAAAQLAAGAGGNDSAREAIVQDVRRLLLEAARTGDSPTALLNGGMFGGSGAFASGVEAGSTWASRRSDATTSARQQRHRASHTAQGTTTAGRRTASQAGEASPLGGDGTHASGSALLEGDGALEATGPGASATAPVLASGSPSRRSPTRQIRRSASASLLAGRPRRLGQMPSVVVLRAVLAAKIRLRGQRRMSAPACTEEALEAITAARELAREAGAPGGEAAAGGPVTIGPPAGATAPDAAAVAAPASVASDSSRESAPLAVGRPGPLEVTDLTRQDTVLGDDAAASRGAVASPHATMALSGRHRAAPKPRSRRSIQEQAQARLAARRTREGLLDVLRLAFQPAVRETTRALARDNFARFKRTAGYATARHAVRAATTGRIDSVAMEAPGPTGSDIYD